MAASIVGIVLENLNRLLTEELGFLSGLQDEFEKLKSELQLMNAFLTDLENTWSDQYTLKEFLRQIADVANEVDDVIDTYILTSVKYKPSKFHKLLRGGDQEKADKVARKKIQRIRKLLTQIFDMGRRYGISEVKGSSAGRPEAMESYSRLTRAIEGQEVIGLEHMVDSLVEQLTSRESGEIKVISIVGMGGTGKTTLASRIFTDKRVAGYFDFQAWLYVSEDYRAKELFYSLLNYVKEGGDSRKNKSITSTGTSIELEDDKETWKRSVFRSLKNRRFFIVMDDIWTTEVWYQVRDAFPEDSNGSRILITTRNRAVALCSSPSTTTSLFEMPLLDEEASWLLFVMKVFRGGKCPPDLEELGLKLVQRCGGLPLAIVTLAGLLAGREKNHMTWSKFVDNTRFLTHEHTHLAKAIALSYEDLPWRLKPCFLYLVVYPLNYDIPARELLQMWIAEGFVRQTVGDRDVEDVAEEYLENLVGRSLVQNVRRKTDGGIKTCRLHDLLRDFAVLESKDDHFLDVRNKSNFLSTSESRRLSLHCTIPEYISSNPPDAFPSGNLRSLLCFDQDEYEFGADHWKSLFKSFKLLRVLNLGCASLASIPESVDCLIHLRYLKIVSKLLTEVPASICNIRGLQTIDLRYSYINSLPADIWKMKELRHVYVSGPMILPRFSSSSSAVLLNLRSLSTVALDEINSWVIIDMNAFPNLTKLGLWCTTQGNSEKLLSKLHNLQHLRTLKIIGTCELPQSPESFPAGLTKITLSRVRLLVNSSFDMLGKLPYLRILKLIGSSNSEEADKFGFSCTAESFPRLLVFQLLNLNISEWIIEKGGMPCLQSLLVKNCCHLDNIPEEIFSLRDVREIQVLQPSPKLSSTLQHIPEKDGRKVVISPLDEE